MKRIAAAMVVVLSMAGAASAQSAKNAVQLANYDLIGTTASTGGWTEVLRASLRTSEQKDLIIGVSLETGLFTETTVRSKNGTQDTSWAEANVEVAVWIGNRQAEPGNVTFDKRRQTLMAKLGGVLNCSDLNGDGTIGFNECSLTDEEIQLILDTKAAHAFNFALDNLGSGTHTVRVLARIRTDKGADTGTSSATGLVGKGSVTVEEVRLVKDIDITR